MQNLENGSRSKANVKDYMMLERCGLLLTGATGALGQEILRRLLRRKIPVTVIVRSIPGKSAQNRIDELVAIWQDLSGRIQSPVVIDGDLGLPGLGLSPADRRWIACS